MKSKHKKKADNWLLHQPRGFSHVTGLVLTVNATEEGKSAIQMLRGAASTYASLLNRFGGPQEFHLSYDAQHEPPIVLSIALEHKHSDKQTKGH